MKAVLVHEVSPAGIELHIAGLELPRCALSRPAGDAAESPIAAFVELWGGRDELLGAITSWPVKAGAWLVEENLVTDYERTWPSGSESPGVRLVSSVYRLPGLDRTQFAEYWRTRHAEIALSYTVPVWRYSQNVVVESFDPEASEDGFAVLHFRTAEDMQARWARYPEQARIGAEDAARFMDVDRGWNATMVEMVWERSSGGRQG